MAKMIDEVQARLHTPAMEQRCENHLAMCKLEVITLASLIEKEAVAAFGKTPDLVRVSQQA
ncbi:MAG: endolytic transglycosylase MltG [Desulfobacterales bacterium]|nr:endolytic transglycosylase MltG [Desulfobacterales bacterium]